MDLIFVTSNRRKLISARKMMRRFNIKVVQKSLDIKEIRSYTIKEIAVDKAEQAFKVLKKPLMVEDSGFIVKSLGNFPGPYVNFVLENIGITGLLKLVGKYRSCFFRSLVAYIDEKGKIKTFTCDEEGTLAKKASEKDHHEAWSDLWKTFIPKGYNKTINDMTEDEYEEYFRTVDENFTFTQLGKWLTSGKKM